MVLPSENTECLAHSTKGVVYEIDTIKKTCKRVLSDLSQLADTEIEMEEMPMTVYQRYLKDKFFGETVVIKKENSYSEDTGFPAQRKTVL